MKIIQIQNEVGDFSLLKRNFRTAMYIAFQILQLWSFTFDEKAGNLNYRFSRIHQLLKIIEMIFFIYN